MSGSTYGNGTSIIVGLLGAQTLTPAAGTTLATLDVVGLVSTFDVSASPTTDVTINNLVGVADDYNLNVDSGTVVLDSGILTVDAIGTTDATIDGGGTFTIGANLITANVITNTAVTFAAGGGTDVFGTESGLLTLDLLTSFSPFVGFTNSLDVIDDQGLSFADFANYTISGPGGGVQTIQVNDSSGAQFEFEVIASSFADGTFASATGGPLTISADAGGGTDISPGNLPCFAAGTRIGTERGEVAVEALRVGDRVRTVSGALRPITWIGHRLIDCRKHPRAENVWPVRVLAHAFGDGMPARDLLLSPDHSLFVDGVLMPVRHLVNGAVVMQEKHDRIQYFHIELARHDVLLAECIPAESYLDTGNRHAFANGAAQMALHPEFEPLDWYDDAYAPLCVRGKKLEAARRMLFTEAECRGWRMESEADLHLRAGRRRIDASSVRGKLHRFELPAGTRELRIVSRSGVPAEVDPAAADRRLLGARIGAVFVSGALVTLQDAALVSGFHELESGGGEYWRWTDGAALVRLPAPLARPAALELLVRDTMRHWQTPADRIAAVA